MVEGALGLLLVSVHLSKYNYPGDQVFSLGLVVWSLHPTSLLGRNRTDLVTWESIWL